MAEPFHRIRKIEVLRAGFLKDLCVEFDDHLNALIGARGSGKTTLLELLRFGLASAPEPGRARDHKSLIKRNLGTGKVRLTIETKDGLRYVVERVDGEKPVVLTEQGEVTPLTMEGSALFGVECYSQRQIEDIAEDPAAQLALIDKFAEKELEEIERELKSLNYRLQLSAGELSTLAQQAEDLDEDLDEAREQVRAELAALEDSNLDATRELTDAVHDKALRERERQASEDAGEYLTRTGQQLEKLRREWVPDTDRLVPPDVRTGPNRALVERVRAIVTGAGDDLQALFGQVLERLAQAQGELTTISGELASAHQTQEATYLQLMRQHEAYELRANERLKLKQRLSRLDARAAERDSRQKAHGERAQERRQLVRQLSELRDQRTDVRERVIERLNGELAPAQIRVGLVHGDDTQPFVQALTKALPGSKKAKRVAELLAVRTTPRDLVRALTGKTAVDDLVRDAEVSRPDAEWLTEHLRLHPDLYAIEVVDCFDVPRIEFLDGEWKDSRTLSTGQKCAAVLPILLLWGEKPLLIDEPEGHIDSRHLVSSVLKQIEHMRGRRQFIFASHNANLVVLGNGRVVALESDGLAAHAKAGDVDACRAEIEDVLEGGRDAFEERRKRYGIA